MCMWHTDVGAVFILQIASLAFYVLRTMATHIVFDDFRVHHLCMCNAQPSADIPKPMNRRRHLSWISMIINAYGVVDCTQADWISCDQSKHSPSMSYCAVCSLRAIRDIYFNCATLICVMGWSTPSGGSIWVCARFGAISLFRQFIRHRACCCNVPLFTLSLYIFLCGFDVWAALKNIYYLYNFGWITQIA